jgi:hypothetical protein
MGTEVKTRTSNFWALAIPLSLGFGPFALTARHSPLVSVSATAAISIEINTEFALNTSATD